MTAVLKGKDKNIAVIQSSTLIITDLQSALDLAITISCETGVNNLVISKNCITEDFFILSTKLAGEILQKYVNYGVNLAIYGDFSNYNSKPLHDFIYESNKGKNFFFVSTEEDAIRKFEEVTRKGGVVF